MFNTQVCTVTELKDLSQIRIFNPVTPGSNGKQDGWIIECIFKDGRIGFYDKGLLSMEVALSQLVELLKSEKRTEVVIDFSTP